MSRAVAILLALAAAAALLLFLLSRDSTDRLPERPTEPSGEETAPVPPPLPTEKEGAEPPAPAPPSAPSEEPEAEPVPLLVEALGPRGSPLIYAEVYALDAGSPGGDANVRAEARVDREGRAKLELPKDELYDVGVIAGAQSGTALLLDVAVPRSGPLRISVPAAVRVTVRAAAELTIDEPMRVSVFHARRSDARGVTPPGRGEVLGTTYGTRLEPDLREATLMLTEGTLYRIRAAGATANPDPFAPPGTVVLHPAPRYRLLVHVRYRNGGEQWRYHVFYQLRDSPPLPLGAYSGTEASLTVPSPAGEIQALLKEPNGRYWHGAAKFENLHPERKNELTIEMRPE